jgi:hypothetical protein
VRRWGVAALAVLVVAGGITFALIYVETATRGDDLAGAATQACTSGAVAPSPDGAALCDQAAQVQQTPVPGPIGQTGPGPTDEQISRAVAAHFAANPPPAGRAPTTAEIAAVVAAYMTANPPAPGRPPTADEIAAAVSRYFTANPVRDGEPGRPPTEGEIRAAVAAELAANPPPRGEPGPPAPSVQSTTKTFSDGSTESCTRSGGPDSDPQFTCTTTAPTGPTDEPPPPPIIGG